MTAVFRKLWVLFRGFIPIGTTIRGLIKIQLCGSSSATLVTRLPWIFFLIAKLKKKKFSSIQVWKEKDEVLSTVSFEFSCAMLLSCGRAANLVWFLLLLCERTHLHHQCSGSYLCWGARTPPKELHFPGDTIPTPSTLAVPQPTPHSPGGIRASLSSSPLVLTFKSDALFCTNCVWLN